MSCLSFSVFAEGSKDMIASGNGHRAHFLSSDMDGEGIPFPTKGTVKVYAKVGERLFLGSSAVGIGSGRINVKVPQGGGTITYTTTTQGVISNRSQEVFGPSLNGGADGGYIPYIITVGAGQEGIWEIDFISPSPTTDPRSVNGTNHPPVNSVGLDWVPQLSTVPYIAAFDVSVRNAANTGFVSGRAFMNVFNGTLSAGSSLFYAQFNILTYDGYLYEVDNNGQAGYIFSFFVNNKGFKNGSGDPAYRSVTSATTVNTKDPRTDDTATDFTHKIFFNTPAADLPEDAPTPTATTWLRKPIKALSVSDVLFTGFEGTENKAGTFPLGGLIKFKTSQPGSYDINIDINNNGIFNENVDVRLTGTAVNGDNEVRWNGLDGNGGKVYGGVPLSPNQLQVSLVGGEVHFPFLDVENNVNGIIIKRINGANAPDYTVHWNDEDITASTSVPIPKKTPIGGANSSSNGHKYGNTSYSTSAYGNKVGLDTWAYLVSAPQIPYLNITFREADLEVVSILANKTTYCVGEEMVYTVRVRNNGPDDVEGAKFFFDYPAEFTITDITTSFLPANIGNQIVNSQTNTTQYNAVLNLINGAELTYIIKGTLSASPAGGVITKASVMRPKDVTDPDATHPDAAEPTDPEVECNYGTVGCNNIKTHSNVTLSGVTINMGSNQTVTEGTGGIKTMTFPVTLSTTSNCDITIDYEIAHLTTDAADFIGPTSGTLIVPKGQTQANIVLQIATDNIIERNEEFKLVITNPSGLNTIGIKEATGTIENDDSGIINVTKVDGYEEGAVPAKLIFSFANGVTSDCDLEIDFTLGGTAEWGGVDYIGTQANTVIIPAGQSTYELIFPVINDDIIEGNETIFIAAVQSIRSRRPENGNLQSAYNISLNPNVPSITIFDNDKGTIKLSGPVTLNEGDTNYTDFTFNVTLDKETAGAFTLNFKTADGTALVADNDYEPQNRVVTIPKMPGTYPVTVRVIGDHKIESDEYFHVTISDLSNNYSGNLSITQGASIGYILNDDSGILDIVSENTTEGGAAAYFAFTLRDNKVADTDIIISYTLTGKANGNGIDYDKPQTGTITLLKGQSTVHLYLNTYDDGLVEGTEDVVLTVNSLSHPGITLSGNMSTLYIFDINRVQITVADAQVIEGNAGTSLLRFKAVLNGRTDRDFTLPFTIQDIETTLGTDYTVTTISPISFSPNLATQEVNIDIAVKGDYDIEGDETLQLILGAPSKTFNGALTVQSVPAIGTIIDDDSGQITVTASNGKEENEEPVVFTFSFPVGVTATTATEINFTLAGSTASAGTDYKAPTVYKVTIPANTNSATLTIRVNDDDIIEGTETIVLTPSPIIGNPGVTINTHAITAQIEDNDKGTITLTGPPSIIEGDNGVNTINYTIKLDKEIQTPIQLSYRTADITAFAGEDYDGVLDTYTFLPGLSEQEITVPVNIRGDKKIEADEVFRLILNPLLQDFDGRLTISNPYVETTIVNDDLANIVIHKIDGKEGSQDARFTIGFDDGYSADVPISISYTLGGTAQNPSDYTGASSGVLTINPGQSTVQLDLPVVDDNLVENLETVTITLANTLLPYHITFTELQKTLNIIDNDAASISISNASVVEGNESDTYLVFDVELTGANVQDAFSLPFTITEGTATVNVDYEVPASITLYFNGPADRNKQIRVLVKGDLIIEKDETLNVALGLLSANFGGRLTIANPNAVGTIVNNDKGIIQIVPSHGNEEGAVAGFFHFNFLNGITSDEPTTIRFNLGGSAENPDDYTTANSAFVTIPAGLTSGEVKIEVIDDDIVENTETVILTTTGVDTAYPTAVTVSNSPQTVNILDNDKGELVLITEPDVTEGADGETKIVKFKVKLTKATASPFSVNYQFTDITATNGNDYQASNGTWNFEGKAGEEKEVSVIIVGDSKIEDSETFRFQFNTSANLYNGAISIPNNTAVFTIINDDSAQLSITKQDGEEGGNDGYFTISFPSGYTADLPIQIGYTLSGAQAGDDYKALPGTITLPANTNSINIPIEIIDDAKVEGDEFLTITANIVTPVYGVTFANNSSTLKITDNDFGTVTINDVTVNEQNNGVHTLSFDVLLDTETETAFNVNYKTEDGTAIAGEDYEATTGTLTFGGAKDEVQHIQVKYYGDKKVEADETFKAILQSLYKTFDGHLSISTTAHTGTATLKNDDSAVVAVAVTHGSENGTKGVFRFYLENGATSDKPVTLNYQLGGTALNVSAKKDYDITHPTSVTIPAGENYVDVELTIVDDTIVEGTETVELKNVQVFSGYGSAITLSPTIPVLNITDNDNAEITITAVDELTEGNTGDFKQYRFTVKLNEETADAFNVNYTVTDGTAQRTDGDYVINPTGTLNFLGEKDEPHYIDVQINGDDKIEPDEDFVVTLSSPSNNFENRLTIPVKTKKGIIKNDDFADIVITKQDGAEGGQPAAFIFTLGNNKTVDEDISIEYILDNVSAKAGEDYTINPTDVSPLLLKKGSNSVALTLNVIDDNIVEGTETVNITAHTQSNLRNNIIISNPEVTLNIEDNDEATLSIQNVSKAEGDSNTTIFTFTAELDKATQKPFSVKYATIDGTAIAGEDYQGATGTLNFGALSTTSQTFSVQVNGDKKIEADEVFNVLLSDLSTDFGGKLHLPTLPGTGTIINDDEAVINITSLDGGEGFPQRPRFRFEITNGNTSDQAIVINYSLEGTATSPSDYTVVTNSNVTSNSVTIPAGSTYVDLEFDVVDDDIVELTETISFKAVSINTTSTAYPSQITLSNDRPVIEIKDNDSAELQLTGIGNIIEGNSSITKINYRLKLTKSTQDPFIIKLATEDGLAKQSDNDYFFLPQDIIHPGNKDIELSITVDIIGDTKVEANEDFFFNILGVSNNYEGRLTIPTPSIKTWIDNDDFADITITAKDGEEAPANNKPGIFTFSLPPGITVDEDLIIKYTLDGTAKSPADYAPVSGEAIIKKGTNSVDVQIDVVDDDIVEGDETVILTATLPNVHYGIQFKDNTNTATLKIIDNDYGLVSINDVQVQEQHSGEHTLTFNVSIDKEVSQPFKVYYHTEDQTATAGEDYKAVPPSAISIGRLPSDNNPINITYYGDRKVEADEIFRLVLTGLEDLFSGHLTLDPAKHIGLGTLRNDDNAEIKVTAIHGKEDGDNGKAIYKFTLVDRFGNEVTSDKPVTINYHLGGTAVAADYNLANNGLATEIVIPAEESSIELVFNIVDDEIVEGTETVILEDLAISSAYANEIKLGTSIPVLEIRDNDTATLTVISEPKILEGDSGETDYIFTVKLDKATSKDFTVNYQTQDITATAGEDYVATTGTLTFSGNKDEPHTVTVKIKGDHVVEPDETFSLLFGNPSRDFEGLLTFPKKDIIGTIENDDFTSIKITTQKGKEGAQNATFTFELTNGKTVDEDLEISYNLDNISAKIGEDYTIDPTEVSPLKIPKGSNSVTLTLKVIDDNLVEGTEEVNLTASVRSNPRNNIALVDNKAKVEIEDNDSAVISITNPTITEGDSGTQNLEFTVLVSQPTQEPFTVKYSTADGTAKVGSDYISEQNGILAFDKDNTSRNFSIKIIGDKVVEATEQFYVALNSLSNNFGGHLTLPAQPATATIVDNDYAKISITGTNGKEEGPVNGQFVFRILDGYSSDTPFTIDYDLTGDAVQGEDYSNAATGTITFEPGETEKVLQIEVIDDDKVEDDETVILTAKLNSIYPQITLNNSVSTIKIEDNDAAIITLTGVKSVVEGKDGYRELTYTVKLNNSSANPFDIAYFTEDITAKVADEDYLEAKGTLSFRGYEGEEHTFTVFVKGDEKVELDETFRVSIKAVDASPLSNRLNITGSPIVVTIVNDDEGKIHITKIDGAETADNSKPAQFVFGFNGNITSEKDIKIPYSLSTNSAIGNGVDYTGDLNGVITIPAGQQTATLTLPVIDDDIVEGTETVTLTVVNPTLPKDVALANTSQTLSIIDNDEAYITIQNVNVQEGNSGNTLMEFSVAIDKPTQEGFSISYKTEDGTALAGEDYVSIPAGVTTFNRLSKETLKISVTVTGDTKVEADETLKLILTALSNTYEGRLHLPSNPAIGTIINDDNAKIAITGTNGKEEGKVTGTFKFTLLDGVTVDQPITITYNLGGSATGNNVDYNDLLTAGTLVIPAGEHSGTVFINVVDDSIIEDTEDVIIEATLANNPYPNNIALNATTHTIEIEDNDYGTLSINGPLSIIEGNSGSQILYFDVTLSNPTTRSFTVEYETEDGTATLDDNDYQYAKGILSFDGQKANDVQQISVAINGDTKVEGDEFFKVILKGLSDKFGDRLRIVGSPAIANIIDDDNIAFNKTITIKKQDGEEGLSDAAFIFSYPPGVTLDTDTKINFNLSGTAEINKDYTIIGSSSSITIEAGKNSATLRLRVIDDEIVEDTEQVDLTVVGAPINQKYPDVKMDNNTSTLFIEDNDYGKITAQSRLITEGDSGTKEVVFTLRLDKETAKDFKLKFHTEDGTAKTSDFDYIAVDDEVFFNGKANEPQEIKVRIIGDKKIEADEYFELLLTQLSNTFNNRLSIVNTKLTGTIENDDKTNIIVTKTDGEEGGSPVTFTFTLEDDVTADEPILIDYEMMAESTAIGNGIDYIGATSGTVTIKPGDHAVTLVLDVVDDELIEDDETIVLKVNAIRGKYTNEIAIPTESTTAYIKDNDNAEIRILGPVEVTEGDVGTTEAKFTVILNNNVGNPFTVNYRTVDGTATVADNDYIPKSGTLDFGGTKGERKEIIILVNGDKKIEGDEDFFVQLSGLSNDFNKRLIIEIDKARGIIIDDDNIEANKIIHITKTDGAEKGDDVVFTFSFPQNVVSDYPTRIPYALSGVAKGAGIDYIGDISGEVIIPAGENKVTLRLPVIDDEIVEGTEVIELTTGNVINENYGKVSVSNSPIQAYILDDDYGKIRIEDAQISEGDLAYKQIKLDVVLDKETGLPFTITYNTEDGTAKVADNDYVAVNNGTLSFDGKAGEKQTIEITIVGDKKIEADEVFDVVLKALSSTFEGRLSIQKNRGTATILNDDTAEIIITAMDGAEAGTIPVRFKFSYPLGYTSDVPTVLNYTLGGTATAGGVDYKGSVNGVFAIPADKESAILELPVIDDDIVEDDETVSIAINSINTNYPASITVNPKLPVAKIMDNDSAILKLSNPVTQKEGDNGTTAYTFNLTLEKETGRGFVVKYTTADGTATVADKDYTHTAGELPFAGKAGEVQSVTVLVNGDLKIEADEDFKFKVFDLSETFNNRLTIPVTETKNVILNDDSSLITVIKVDGIEGMQDGQFVFALNPGVTSDKDITIHFKLSGTATASDYIALPSATSITIPAGENRAVLTIKTLDDDIVEETETVVLNVTKIDNPYNNVSMVLPIPVLNIYDNDTGYLTITSPAPVLEGHSGTKTVTFTVTLDKTTDKPFTVNYTTVDGTATVADKDYVKASGYLSFAGYTGETKKVDVTIIGDTKYEDDETFGLKLMNLAPTFDGQLTIGTDGKGVILNDDFAPMAMDDYVTTLEDEPVTFSVTANDKHDEGIDPKTVKIVTPPSIGKVVVHADGTVTYSPDKDVNGYDTFTYTVKDIFGRLSNEARVQITIIPVNDAPIAVDDIYYVQRDSSIRENVGLNDYDVDGDVLTFRVLEFPKHGKIEFFDGMDGAFVYVPNPGFTGIDTFVYEVKDPEGLKDTANVTLYVQPKVRVDLTPVLTVVTEGEVVKITAKLSEPLFQDVNVVLDFSGTAELNKDYTLEGNFDVIRIAAGDTVTTQYFLVKTLRDFIKEEDETVEAKIIAVDPSNFVTIGDSALVVIQDFYPEGKEPELNENGGIHPDPYMSPNGDGLGNEVFVIYNIDQYPDNEVVIYNRWGNEVFRIKGYNNKDISFSGKANAGMMTNKNEDLIDGVYFFIIHTKDTDGKPLLNKGYVIIKR
ncbi:Calx-beta domain-containing protein [Pseudopedobacter beijingensis]|uniref:Calx-beta domain-containing protein n=1 Tax=Pseudopedobacter beijingensis TaxID=1207056 RepID=A0ABW4I967_9SPHI